MKKPDNKQLARIGALFIAAVAAGWLVWLFATGKADEFARAITSAHPGWILAGMACFVCYFGLDALCFRISGTLTGVRLGAADLISVAASGIVFGYLTPGNTGAAPAQIVRLSQAGLSVGDASAVQLTRFFIYQAALTSFGAAMLIARFSYFHALFGNVVLLAGLAFLGHLGIMAMLVCLIFFPNLVRRIGNFGIKLFSERFHFIKDPEKARAALESEIDQYATSVSAAVHHAGIIVSSVIVSILQLISIFLIPYFVLLALGATDVDPFTAIASAAFVQLVLTAIPLPGGTGGAEGGFYVFFGPQLGDAISTGVVLWRLISYYLPILVSFPLLACKSRLTPREREEMYGEAQVGRAQIQSDARIARQKAQEQHVHTQVRIAEAQIRAAESRERVRAKAAGRSGQARARKDRPHEKKQRRR